MKDPIVGSIKFGQVKDGMTAYERPATREYPLQRRPLASLAADWAEAETALPDLGRMTVIRYSDEQMAARHCYRYEVNAGGWPGYFHDLQFVSYCNNDLGAALRDLAERLTR